MLKPFYSTKEPAKKLKVGKSREYLDTITGLEFHFKNTLPSSEGWNTFLYENKKYSRTLILHIREIRIKREM
jgi:hypothetical protein